MSTSAQVAFPLAGVWTALNSPADQVPSHGTNYFGQRYAVDFIQVRAEPRLPYSGPVWKHLLTRMPADRFLCWDAPVSAVAAGRVVEVADDWADRLRVNLFYELIRSSIAPPVPRRGDNRPLAGNHIIVESDVGVALYAHLKAGSAAVRPGQRVQAGQLLGRVGNSGNTTMPHLHFQLMDDVDPMKARGLPFVFSALEVVRDGTWVPHPTGVPASDELVRSGDHCVVSQGRKRDLAVK